MTKFIFITDTHIGASKTDYFEQQNYPEHLPEVIRELDRWIEAEGDIDFIIHGGDIVTEPTDKLISNAVDVFSQLSLPVYLCLGNHDMSTANSASRWLRDGSEFFPADLLTYTLKTAECLIHILPTQWGEVPYQSDGKGIEPCLLPEQIQFINDALSRQATHLIVTHHPLLGMLFEQNGVSDCALLPPASLELLKNLKHRKNVPLVVAGHNHVNTIVHHDFTHSVTCSSLSETPFEFKVIEIQEDLLSVKTVSLASRIEFIGNYNFNKTFVQGRSVDRFLEYGLTQK
jgi:3',5'-cyclic-AMP phosphodiesterase